MVARPWYAAMQIFFGFVYVSFLRNEPLNLVLLFQSSHCELIFIRPDENRENT